MRRLFGGRTAVEAVFLIAVPITALAAGLSALGIIVASAVAYGLVLAFEGLLARGSLPKLPQPKLPHVSLPERPKGRSEDAPRIAEAAAGQEEDEEWVQPVTRTVQPRRPEPEPETWVDRQESSPGPPATIEPEPEPELVADEPEHEPEPEPERRVEPALHAVPPPIAEPEPEPAADESELAAVVPIGTSTLPRQWNVWELERLTRESAGSDPGRDEERTFLLLYLREFADPNGLLPVDFDSLVRESFGDLVGV